MADPVCVCGRSHVGLGSPASQGLVNPSGYCCQSPDPLSLRLLGAALCPQREAGALLQSGTPRPARPS